MNSKLKPIGSLLSETWKLYKKHMNALALVAVIPFIFSGVKSILASMLEQGDTTFSCGLVFTLAALIIFAILSLVFNLILPIAMTESVNELHHGRTAEVSVVYKKAFAHFVQYLFIIILSVVIFLGGSIVLIIPGIVVSIYIKFAIYAYLFEGKKGLDALVTSAWYVRGMWWDILFRYLGLAVIILASGAAFTLVVGTLSLGLSFGITVFGFLLQLFVFMFVIPFTMAYVYLLYKEVKAAKGDHLPTAAFVDEAETTFIMLIVIAGLAVLSLFFILNLPLPY